MYFSNRLCVAVVGMAVDAVASMTATATACYFMSFSSVVSGKCMHEYLAINTFTSKLNMGCDIAPFSVSTLAHVVLCVLSLSLKLSLIEKNSDSEYTLTHIHTYTNTNTRTHV